MITKVVRDLWYLESTGCEPLSILSFPRYHCDWTQWSVWWEICPLNQNLEKDCGHLSFPFLFLRFSVTSMGEVSCNSCDPGVLPDFADGRKL